MKPFLFFLTNKQGQSYTIENGVATTALPTPLPNAPDGWNDQAVAWGRNMTYWGIMRSYTIPLKFVTDGATILRSRFYNHGLEDHVDFIILRYNPETGRHESFYKGKIDFYTANDQTDYFEVSVKEGGLVELIKANENTVYEINMGLAPEQLNLDGLNFRKSALFQTYDGTTRARFGTLPIVNISEEGTTFGVIIGNKQDVFEGGSRASITIPLDNDDNNFLVRSIDTPIQIQVNGSFTFFNGGSGQNIRFFALVYRNNLTWEEITIVPNAFYSGNFAIPEGVQHTVNYSLNLTLNQGERFYIAHEASIGDIGPSGFAFKFTQSDFPFKFISRFRETSCTAIRARSLAQLLLDQMTGGGYTVSGTILDEITTLFTSGDSIRRLSPILKTSFKDFFAALHRNFAIGIDVVGREAVFAKKQDFFDANTTIKHLGAVKNASFGVDSEFTFSRLKVGYNEQRYDDVNGRDEFNNTLSFKTNRTMINKELDLTALYRADMYGIEFARVNLEGKTTTDNSSDNEVFMIDSERIIGSVAWKIRRPSDLTITGVLDPSTAFNVTLSPKRILFQHGSFIRGCLWPNDESSLTYLTTEKNSELRTVDGLGNVVKEKEDVLVGDLARPYFYPIQVKFETEVPENVLQLINDNRRGLFTFEYTGELFGGFVMEVSQKPSDNAEQEWTLLLSTKYDIRKLIQ